MNSPSFRPCIDLIRAFQVGRSLTLASLVLGPMCCRNIDAQVSTAISGPSIVAGTVSHAQDPAPRWAFVFLPVGYAPLVATEDGSVFLEQGGLVYRWKHGDIQPLTPSRDAGKARLIGGSSAGSIATNRHGAIAIRYGFSETVSFRPSWSDRDEGRYVDDAFIDYWAPGAPSPQRIEVESSTFVRIRPGLTDDTVFRHGPPAYGFSWWIAENHVRSLSLRFLDATGTLWFDALRRVQNGGIASSGTYGSGEAYEWHHPPTFQSGPARWSADLGSVSLGSDYRPPTWHVFSSNSSRRGNHWAKATRRGISTVNSAGTLVEYEQPDAISPVSWFVGGQAVDYTPIFLNDNGTMLGRIAGAEVIIAPDGTRRAAPTEIGAQITWVDEFDRPAGNYYGRPASWSVRTENGQVLYDRILYERITPPEGWDTDHYVAPDSRRLQLGILTNIATKSQRAFLAIPAAIVVDANRDGEINLPGTRLADIATRSRPFRFWINDDDDDGDISATGPTLTGNPDEPGRLAGFWELDGRTPDHEHVGVDGRSDLIDFFPAFLDIKTLLRILPHTGADTTYKLRHADSALNAVYTNLARAEALDYLRFNKERAAYGLPDNPTKAHEAPTAAISSAGHVLDSSFLTGAINEIEKGLLLIEGKRATDNPLQLVVEKSGKTIAEVSLRLKISEVEKMYRWINLRGITGQSVSRTTDTSQPPGYPDCATNGKMFIFVHGYNVNERGSRAWNAEAFKRMWQSGSRAMFTAVSWNGDYGQIPVVGVAPDYWENVTRAFQTSQALAPVINSLPGSSKVIAGHSMGNIVSSAAIVDHGMNIAKYLMVDAAVAIEAYDVSALDLDAMRHPDWADYSRRLWPTDWHALFPSGDGRRGLTWMNRFGNIPNAINIYSSGEEVLNNNDITPGNIPPIGTERVWIIQEMAKGTTHLAALLTFDIQGGWGFNGEWRIGVTTSTGGPHGSTSTTYRNRTPAEASTLTDAQLRAEPFFRRFQNASFRNPTGGSAAAAEYVARANALGGAIPALSFSAGRNRVPLFEVSNRNRDLMDLQDGWPHERFSSETGWVQGTNPKKGRWWHSDIKNIAYTFNRGAWELFVNEGDLK